MGRDIIDEYRSRTGKLICDGCGCWKPLDSMNRIGEHGLLCSECEHNLHVELNAKLMEGLTKMESEIKLDPERADQQPDAVYHPSHYTQWEGMEPLTFFILNEIPFAEASVCKYVLRWKLKNGIEDLKKARRLVDMLIEMEENRADYTPKKTCL